MYRFKSCNKNLTKNFPINSYISYTPVSFYSKLKDIFPGALLLESNSFNVKKNNFSIICLNAIAEIILDKNYIYYIYPDKCEEKISLSKKKKYMKF